jgi:hypothetical protein
MSGFEVYGGFTGRTGQGRVFLAFSVHPGGVMMQLAGAMPGDTHASKCFSFFI